jgi:hypothetical protein
MLKLRLLLLSLFLIVSSLVRSQVPEQLDSLVIHYKDGSTEVIRLQSIQKIYFDSTTVLSVRDAERSDIPFTIAPNPASGYVTIQLSKDVKGELLTICDGLGNEVMRFAASALLRQDHTVYWNGRDSEGRSVAPGVYFVRLQTNEGIRIRKIVIQR